MDELLKIELRILVLRHGRRNVLEALASLGNETAEEIEREIDLAEKRKASRKSKPISAIEIASELCRDKPESIDTLTKLANRYENRTFLPELRDVKRFLERSGVKHSKVSSRRAAARQVLTVLNQLSMEDLKRLTSAAETHGDSDFALLAKEIMGSHHRAPAIPDRKS
jgi:hypothetical protein